MTKILITGGSGLVGQGISELLLKEDHEPRWLSRESGIENGIHKFRWDPEKNYLDESAFEGVEYLIHLAGAGIIDKAWTPSYKKKIIDSRVKSSELLFAHLAKNKLGIRAFVGASAVGYYGSEPSEHWQDETDPPGNDFLSRTCIAWEQSYRPFSESGIRTAILRTGVVLSSKGGAYAKMLAPFKWGLGAAIGNGKHYLPWIHISDLSRMYVYALFNELNGTYNAVASVSASNLEFSYKLAQSLHRPLLLPNVPEFLLKMVLGERAVTVTRGLKVSNAKIKAAGFRFEFDDLEKTLNDLKENRH